MGVFVIGIGGATSSGKTSICKEIHQKFPHTFTLYMDDYYFTDEYPKHELLAEYDYGFIHWDTVTAIDFDRMIADIESLVGQHRTADNSTTELSDSSFIQCSSVEMENSSTDHDNNKVEAHTIILIDGILIYEYEPLQRYFTRKYFFTLTREEAERRRHAREYPRHEPHSYFDHYAWPCYVKCLDKVLAAQQRNGTGTICDHDQFIILSGNDSLDDNCKQITNEIKSLNGL